MLQAAEDGRFPNCKRSEQEEERAEYLNELLRNPYFTHIPRRVEVKGQTWMPGRFPINET